MSTATAIKTNHPYTIKGYKHHMSHDGECFVLTLVKGKTGIATVENDGWGGDNCYRFNDRAEEAEFYAYAKSLGLYESKEDSAYGMEMTYDADLLVGDLIAIKEMNSKSKKNTLFFIDDEDWRNGYRSVNAPMFKDGLVNGNVALWLKDKYREHRVSVWNPEAQEIQVL